MEDNKSKMELPAEGIETTKGYLYHPPNQSTQILFLIASFFTAILLGWIISSIPGDLSDFAKGVIYFVFILVIYTRLYRLGNPSEHNSFQQHKTALA